ncbi:unnamed protein product [Arabidopsis lyrata]|nr:unnamed protein product [Arabidopsis lyrata]
MAETRSTSHHKLIPMKYSWEEINTRREAGLCIFCDEQETQDHHLKHKRLRLVMVDLAYTSLVDVEDLKRDSDLKAEEDKKVAEIEVKTEVETKLTANLVQEAFLEDESTPQVQVPIANSEILKSIEPREVNLGLESLESVVMNENLEQDGVQKKVTKRFEVDGNVEKTQKVLSVTEICCAHQVFGKMSQHEEKLGIKKEAKGFKSWMFKFKPIKEKIKKRDNKGWFHTWSRKPSWKKNKVSKTWSMLNVDCFKDDDQVYLESLSIGLLIRFTFWKFKFIKRNLQKTSPQIEEVMMREDHKQQHGDSEPLATAPDYDIKFMKMNLQKKMGEHGYVNHGKLMFDKERHDDILRRYNLQWKIQKLKCCSKSSQFEFPNKNASGYNLDRDFVLEMDHWYHYVNLETGSFLKTDSISELELESTESNMETNSVAQPQVSIFVLESSQQQKLLEDFDMNTVSKDQQYVLAEALSPLFDNFRSEVAAFCEQSTCVKSHQRKQRLSPKSWMFKYKLGKEWKRRRNISFLCLIVVRALHVDRLQERKMPLLLKYNCRTVLAEEYNTRCLSVPWIKHKSKQLLSITISVSGFNRASHYQVYLCLFLAKTLASQFQLWYGGEATRYCYKLLLQLFLQVKSTTRQREQFSSAQVRSELKGNSFKYGRMRGAKGLAEESWLRIRLRRSPHLKQPKTWSFKYKQQKNYHDVLVKEPERIS